MSSAGRQRAAPRAFPSPRCHRPQPAGREGLFGKEDAHEIRKMREAVLLSPSTRGSKGNTVI